MDVLPSRATMLLADQVPILDAIDKLRSFGIESGIDVPQLIVIGDQSSGKSSVLEAISGAHFTIDHKLCTKFPIELSLRQSKSNNINVKASLVSSTTIKRNDEENATIKSFERSDSQPNDIPQIISDAEALLGVSHNVERQFSDDILKINISGPGLHPLTIIDLPGLIRGDGLEQRGEAREFVRGLVERYASDSRSIILAVVPASSVDIATQESHTIAKMHDKKQERTLGIITRPDSVLPGPETETIVEVASSGPKLLKRGWHTVRNLSAKERKDISGKKLKYSEISRIRDEKEEVDLNQGSWAKVPTCDKGIVTLREKLSRILFEQVQAKLRDLIKSVRIFKEDRASQLKGIDKPRTTPEEQRAFLVPMAQEYVRLANAAITGSYEDPFFGKPGDTSLQSQSARLRATILEMSRLFNIVLVACGRKMDIYDGMSNGDAYSNVVDKLDEREDIFAPDYVPALAEKSSALFQDISSPILGENELQRYRTHRKPFLVRWKTIGDFMCSQVTSWSGREGPADANPSLAKALFQMQSNAWVPIVEDHSEAVWTAVESFVTAACRTTIPDSVRPGVADHIIGPSLRVLGEKFKSKCKEIVEGFRQVDPTQFVHFESVSETIYDELPGSPDDLLTKNVNNKLNQMRLTSAMKSWHLANACRRDTRDAMAPSIQALAIELYIRQVPSLFSPDTIMKLTTEILAMAAGDSNDDIERRKSLAKDIADLGEAETTLTRLLLARRFHTS